VKEGSPGTRGGKRPAKLIPRIRHGTAAHNTTISTTTGTVNSSTDGFTTEGANVSAQCDSGAGGAEGAAGVFNEPWDVRRVTLRASEAEGVEEGGSGTPSQAVHPQGRYTPEGGIPGEYQSGRVGGGDGEEGGGLKGCITIGVRGF